MEELYETYYMGAKSTDLKKNEKLFLCDFFKNLSNDDDKEVLYVLIYYYHLFNEPNELDDIDKIDSESDVEVYPYKSIKNKLRGVDFPLSKLPYKLRNMLYNFCKVLERKEDDEVLVLNIKKNKLNI